MQKINDLGQKMTRHSALFCSAINRVLSRGWLIMGPELENFERLFALYCQTAYCLGVANGTDAIELALKSLGIKPGDRVATAANAGMYTTTAILAIGAKPFFIDVALETQEITLAEVIRAIEAGVNAVVATHLYGRAIPEIVEIAQYCAEKNIPLLEDCAQAHGAKISGSPVGAFGDAASFSFYPTKNLGALGDAGAIVTNSLNVAEKIKQLRQYGWTEKYNVKTLGGRNSRLDEIQAAILCELLPYLDIDNARRLEIAHRYTSGIHNPNLLMPSEANTEYVAHLYVIRTPYRSSLQRHLLKSNISSDIHYPIPDYAQSVLASSYENIRLKNTEQLANEVLTLPCYPEMSDIEIDRVIAAINSWQP